MSSRDPAYMGGCRTYDQFLRGEGSTGPFEPEPFDEDCPECHGEGVLGGEHGMEEDCHWCRERVK